MWAAIIAVTGTLAGGLLTGMMQARVSRTAREDARDEQRRAERLAAVADFTSAVANHRRAMWVREDLRLNSAELSAVATARQESHMTRSAITSPLVRLKVVAPALAAAADAAAEAAYELRNAPDTDALSERRRVALEAENEFVQAASAHFAEL
ncbi:protein kilB [Actinomadura hibisca]|uniref:protein kilB n=1 Tax=Actinomadura hibisca TaxID=68565 RepID=UPI00082B9CAB|nr:protein kilB [Actinomadura hibisca]